MKVTNINGTSQNVCKCGSWLKHWENFSNQTAAYCKQITCLETDLLGAHVQKDSDTDKNWYIVPLCAKHNKAAGPIELVAGTALVSANKSKTCGN